MTAMNRSTELIDTARNIVAITLRASGREDLAKMMLQGAGDDLPELSATVAALTDLYGQHARLKQALQFYADESCWDDDLPGGALTMHDRGEVARNALLGRDIFRHRD